MDKEKFKVNFNFVTNMMILAMLLFGGAAWADSNGVWTYAKDIRGGTFGADEGGGDYEFPNNVNVSEDINVKGNITVVGGMNGDKLCMNGECYSSWSNVCDSWVTENSVN